MISGLHDQKMLRRVICLETRPYNQGSRLTATELSHQVDSYRDYGFLNLQLALPVGLTESCLPTIKSHYVDTLCKHIYLKKTWMILQALVRDFIHLKVISRALTSVSYVIRWLHIQSRNSKWMR